MAQKRLQEVERLIDKVPAPLDSTTVGTYAALKAERLKLRRMVRIIQTFSIIHFCRTQPKDRKKEKRLSEATQSSNFV